MYNNPPCSAGGRKLFRSWASSSRVRFWWRRPPRSGCSQNPSPCRKNCACSRRTEVGRHPKAWPTWLAFSPSAARSQTHCTRWNSALLRAPRKACANRSTEPSGKDRGGRIAPSIKVSQEGAYISIFMNATWYHNVCKEPYIVTAMFLRAWENEIHGDAWKPVITLKFHRKREEMSRQKR